METNPYLKDPNRYRESLITSVASSTAIETGQCVETLKRILRESDFLLEDEGEGEGGS